MTLRSVLAVWPALPLAQPAAVRSQPLVSGRGRTVRSPLDAAANEHAAEEDDHGHDRGRHEQEHQLFTVQLDLVEAVVLA